MAVHVGGRGPGHLARVQGFSIDLFLAEKELGFWADFTRTDTSFQESVGPTAANAAGNPIALTLDQRLWNGQSRVGYVAGQTELEIDANWTLGTNATRVGGTITQPTNTGSFNFQLVPTVAGRVYRVSFTVTQGTIFCGVWDTAPTSSVILLIGTIGVGTHERYFVAPGADATFSFAGTSAGTNQVTAISIREVSQTSITQATAGSRPLWQPNGAEFNGTAHNLLTNYTAGAEANTLIAKVVVPGSISGDRIVMGAGSTGPTAQCTLGVNAAGAVVGGAGTGSFTTVVGSTDLRDSVAVIAISFQPSGLVRLFSRGGIEYEASMAGSPNQVLGFNIGSRNSSGNPSNLWPGSIQHAIAYRGGGLLDLARFQQIANALGG